jgi:hypothetical protein
MRSSRVVVANFEELQADRLESSITDEDRAMLDKLADGLAKRRLTSAALFFLESSKPMGFLGSQMMMVFRPFIAMAWPEPKTWDRVQNLLEKRGAIELLLRRLESRV